MQARELVFLLMWGLDASKGDLRGSHCKGPAEQTRARVHKSNTHPIRCTSSTRHMTSVSMMTHNCPQAIIPAGVFCQRWISFHHIQLECTAAALA